MTGEAMVQSGGRIAPARSATGRRKGTIVATPRDGEGTMESNDPAWSGESWRLPLWLWLGLGAMSVGTLHILLDASVGLFPARGRLAPAVAAALLLISLIHAWWGVSL